MEKAESVERKSIWGYTSRPSWFLQLFCTNPEAVRRTAVRGPARRPLPPRRASPWRSGCPLLRALSAGDSNNSPSRTTTAVADPRGRGGRT